MGADLLAFLEANPDIAEIDAVFVDLSGRLRGKRVPRAEAAGLASGSMMIPQAIMALTTPGECLDAGGRGISDGDPDGVGLPVPGSASPLPWSRRPVGQVLMRMVSQTGDPLGCDPRNVLDRVVGRLAKLGLKPVVAFEVEFHLIDRQRGPGGAPQFPALVRDVPAWSRSHGMVVLDALSPLFQTITEYADAMGLKIGSVTSETGVGQFEINLHHTDDPGRAADEVILLRQIITNAAQAHDMDATFMAKPMADQPGNGLHIHLSLADGEGRNVFALDGGEAALHHALGGIRALMPVAMAIQAPNLNSYRRFVAGNFVPVNRSWGTDNRSVAFRIPQGGPASRRIEHRVAGGDANPYLVLATVLASVVHGLENRIDPGPASTGNANLVEDPSIPTDVLSALDLFSASDEMRDFLGGDYVDLYTDVRRKEFRRLLGVPSPREYEWYL